MGFGFKKSIKIAPGIKLNIGKKSAGISIGGKHGGVSINTKSGTRARASIPGTGISYSTKVGGKSKKATKEPTQIERYIEIFDDSVKIFMSTKNPDTYWGRYKDAQDVAEKLSKLTKKRILHGEPPTAAVEMLNNDNTSATNAFLDRYSSDVLQKAFNLKRDKKKKIDSFLLKTKEYEPYMTNETINYRDMLYEKMLLEIENL